MLSVGASVVYVSLRIHPSVEIEKDPKNLRKEKVDSSYHIAGNFQGEKTFTFFMVW